MNDAMRIKSAEFWLMLGGSDLASREIESLPENPSRHPWALRVRMTVFSTLSFC